MPPKGSRGAAASSEDAATCKRLRSAIDEGVDEFLCPITQELPVDPVTAKDGHVYERSAIKKWLQRSDKSPVTNLKMGSELLDAKQVRSMLARMVKSGAITGDKATRWKERLKAEEEATEMRRRAEGGDAAAMSDLGVAYEKGEGVPVDDAQARHWYKRSAERGNGRGQTNYAARLWNQGKELHAALLMMEAATRGDPYACIEVAALYDGGSVGHPAQDRELAKRWYLKALACKQRGDGDGFDPEEEDVAKANAWLNANADVAAPWFDAPDRRSQDA